MQSKSIMKNHNLYSQSHALAVKLISWFKTYIKFLPSFFIGSGSAFLIDIIIFTILRNSLGTNISALISLFVGSLTIFTILRFLQVSRIKRKRKGLFIQLCIGIGSLIINLICLNIIDYLTQSINADAYYQYLNESRIYAALSRLVAGCFGFLWTSSMTSKFLFYSTRRKR